MQLNDKIRKHALANAVEHDGTAAVGSVLGRLLATEPELRSHVKELQPMIAETVEEINFMSSENQKKALLEMGGLEKKQYAEKKGLPELVRLDGKKIVVRFAPNPDGALHLGNARPAVLSDEYAKKYNGIFILRFDDTDPKVKVPEKKFYKWIKEDLKWLGVKWKKEVVASKRLKIYYKHAQELVKKGGAYICTCSGDWKQKRNQGIACKCRSLGVKDNLKGWKKMLSGYKEGQAVLRVKTDLSAENPAVRDWPAFRIVNKPKHPLVKKKLWPLFNFASAIDDHLLGVTHILRGQEHATNEAKQRYLYDFFGWTYPKVMILGRFLMPDMVLSKSLIRKGIEEKKFTGWDDPAPGTLRSLRRRGFQPQALRNLIVDVGVKSSDMTVASENLAAYNKKIVDKIADRYFFVPNPRKIVVQNPLLKRTKLKIHPEKKRGTRSFIVSSGFYIDEDDFVKLHGQEIRLIGLYNIILGDISKATDKEIKQNKKIQWVPEKSKIKVEVLMPGRIATGYGEKNLSKAKKNQVIQFERCGFVRIEKKTKSKITAVFGHR
ncbi:MAG: glutamate--tRNA ligase [Candidatus Aenigmarchaeota archaeon]|nr:glutamate--tRNA ligase [Candidatus Aenigmarchaeota archaeon]